MKRVPWLRRLARLAMGGTYFAVALVIGGTIASTSSVPPLAAFYLSLVIICAATFLLVVVHECGHASASAWLGWRVSMISVGPLFMKFHPPRVRIGTPLRGLLGGATWLVPVIAKNWRRGWIVMNAAGGVFNIAFALLVLLGAKLFAGPAAVSIADGLAALSLMMGLMNFIPFGGPAGQRSDGGAILDVLRGLDPEPRAIALRLTDDMISGKSPRDWDPALVKKLEVYAEKPDASIGTSMLYNYYFACGDFVRARAALEVLVGKYGILEPYRAEDALLSAFAEDDPVRAKAGLDKVRARQARRRSNYQLAKALVCASERDWSHAERALSLARKAIKRWPLATVADWELLGAVERRVRSERTKGESPAPAVAG